MSISDMDQSAKEAVIDYITTMCTYYSCGYKRIAKAEIPRENIGDEMAMVLASMVMVLNGDIDEEMAKRGIVNAGIQSAKAGISASE